MNPESVQNLEAARLIIVELDRQLTETRKENEKLISQLTLGDAASELSGIHYDAAKLLADWHHLNGTGDDQSTHIRNLIAEEYKRKHQKVLDKQETLKKDFLKFAKEIKALLDNFNKRPWYKKAFKRLNMPKARLPKLNDQAGSTK